MKAILFLLQLVIIFSSQAQTQNMGAATNRLKLITDENSFLLESKKIGNCMVSLPKDWTGQANPQSSAIDLVNSERTMYAGYGIVGINTNMQVYDRELYSNDHYVAGKRIGSMILATIFQEDETFVYTSTPNILTDGYEYLAMESASYKGLILIKRFQGDMINTSYILSVRFAITAKHLWPSKASLVSNIALNTSCSTTLLQTDLPMVKFDAGKRGKSRYDEEAGESEYNPYLETERIENPLTGEKRTVTLDMWNETGPQGPGYYFKNGNDITKWRSPNN
jgi:hypothetical protein